MASRVAVEAETILDSPSARLTAVAVSMRAGHTIAFLGDSKGNLHKVRYCLKAQIGCQVTFWCVIILSSEPLWVRLLILLT